MEFGEVNFCVRVCWQQCVFHFSALVGSLNSTSGIARWWNKTGAFFGFLGKLCWKRKKNILEEEKQADEVPLSRSTSTTDGKAIRLERPMGLRDKPLTKIDSVKEGDTKIEGQSPRMSTLSVEVTKTDAITV